MLFFNFELFILPKGYVTICYHLSFYFIYCFSKYLYENYSKTENSPEAKEKKSAGGEIEVYIYKSYLRNVFKPPVSAK